MKVYLASDHAGYELKEYLKPLLIQEKYDVEDCGALTLDPFDDYPGFIADATRKAMMTPGASAIIFGKSGAGETIVANKIKGARAILGINEENIKLAREDNDANVLAIGSRLIQKENVFLLVKLFLETKFSGETRHIRRIEQIKKIESES